VIVDHVGGPYLADHVDAAALKGRIVGVGRLGGPLGKLDVDTLARKRLETMGVTFRTRDSDEKAAIAAVVPSDLAAGPAEGRLSPLIDQVLPWDQVLDAQNAVAAGMHLDKVVLKVSTGA